MRTMFRRPRVAVAALFAFAPAVLLAQRGYPPNLPDARVETYKRVGGVELKMWIYAPEGHQSSDRRPAIVFFFGGGWRGGTPAQFAPQARYLASRGMVAFLADYRVASRHGAKVKDCVEDAKSAVRWIRANAARLGVDPDRIAAGGGSAGGHLAAATAIVPDLEPKGEDQRISSAPNALVLFNPVLVLAPAEGGPEWPKEKADMLRERAGGDPTLVSPYHHLRRGLPPAIIFHGRNDEAVPYETAEFFCQTMKSLGNRCELVGYDGVGHGFFNYGRGDGKAYFDTLRRADRFLASLGWLKGEPTLSESP